MISQNKIDSIRLNLLVGKTKVLRNIFYWTGRVYIETIGREIRWTKEKLSIEEDARARKQTLVQCDYCDGFRKETYSDSN